MTDQNETGAGKDVPLVTDLDGTLIKTDLLVVAVKQLVKKNILYLPLFFFLAAERKGIPEEKNI